MALMWLYQNTGYAVAKGEQGLHGNQTSFRLTVPAHDQLRAQLYTRSGANSSL